MARNPLAWVRGVLRPSPTLADLWDFLAHVHRDRVFSIDETGARLTYRETADHVARRAAALRSLGVRAGDRVALCTRNRPAYLFDLFAIARAGGIAVPLHHKLKAAEARARVEQCGAPMFICEPETGGGLDAVTVIDGSPGGELDQLARNAAPLEPAHLEPDAPVAILYTSGTTGTPKGATLTSRSLLSVPRIFQLFPGFSDEVGVYSLPTAHIMGLTTLLTAAYAGTALFWLEKFEAGPVLDLIEREKPSFFVGVPAMYGMLLRAGAEERDLSSVRLWVSGADAMPREWIERFCPLGCAFSGPGDVRLSTSAFAQLYGMVELSGACLLDVTFPRFLPEAERLHRTRARLSATTRALLARLGRGDGDGTGETRGIALPIPPYKAKVVGPEGDELPPGEVGELCVQGPGVTRGYDGDLEATRRVTRDGWLYTGDLAHRGRLGEVTFVGRKKDVIKHGGFSVFPAEVEQELLQHPDVADAVVFGVPHATKSEVPAAVVVLAPDSRLDAQALVAWCRDNVAGYRAPRAVGIARPEDIPRNANAKVLKAELRERWADELRHAFPMAFDD